jgi:2-polyprenyl-3-methyl-5-hydroxy-6-metoxy-1,4-benzoquinol methylase
MSSSDHQLRLIQGAQNIAEFLDLWLQGGVLSSADQAVLEQYYFSYKRHFGPYLRHHYARQTKELIDLISQLGQPEMLEVGCGCGTEALWAAMKGARVTGIDILSDLLEVAKARLRHLTAVNNRQLDCRFLKSNLLDLDGRERFDIIYLEQAFHHLEPRAKVIDKLAELVRPGGRIVFSETNGWNPLHQAKTIKQRGFKTIIEHEGHLWGHERITVPWALIREFRRRSLRVESLEYYRVLPNWRLSDWFLFPRLKLPGLFRPLFTHFNLVLQK